MIRYSFNSTQISIAATNYPTLQVILQQNNEGNKYMAEIIHGYCIVF